MANDEILTRLENVLDQYWNLQKGLPTVREIAKELNLSADYLSDMLRITSGQTAQQHIPAKVIERAWKLFCESSWFRTRRRDFANYVRRGSAPGELS